MLRQLKEEYRLNDKIKWTKISEIMNKNFGTERTPKQCREKYENDLKVSKFQTNGSQWSSD